VEESSQALVNGPSGARSPLRPVNRSDRIKLKDTLGKVVNPTQKPESLCPLCALGTIKLRNGRTSFREVLQAQLPIP
jgi:hypothetical protein